jgi:hypothetical protein
MDISRAVRAAAVCAGFAAGAAGADSALTIYNQNFAVVREILPLDLKAAGKPRVSSA